MENQASYTKIGLFVVMCTLAIIGTLLYVGGVGSEQYEIPLETYFTKPVSGLDVGSTVNFKGVKVGRVKRISFIACEYPESADVDKSNIYVELAMDRRLLGDASAKDAMATIHKLVDKGLHATVSSSGVTGLSHIELSFPKNPVEDRRISWKPRYVNVPPLASILQSAADSAQRILGQFDRIDFVEGWTNIVLTLQSAQSALSGINVLLESQQGNVAEILSNLRDTSAALKEVSENLRVNPSMLLRNNDPTPLEETK